MEKKLLTQGDLCRIMGISRDELEALMSEGMPCYFIGKTFFFDFEATQTWLIERIDLGTTNVSISGLLSFLGFLSTAKLNLTFLGLERIYQAAYPAWIKKFIEKFMGTQNRFYFKNFLQKFDSHLSSTDCDKIYVSVLRQIIEAKLNRKPSGKNSSKPI